MGKRVVEILIDDLSGEESDKVETITYALDGVAYEIELNPKNSSKFRGLFQEYIAVSRKVTGTRRATTSRRSSGGSKRSSEELSLIREWWREQGNEIGDRGRVAQNILDAYDEAH